MHYKVLLGSFHMTVGMDVTAVGTGGVVYALSKWVSTAGPAQRHRVDRHPSTMPSQDHTAQLWSQVPASYTRTQKSVYGILRPAEGAGD